MAERKLSVILPAFNEETNLGPTLDRLETYLEGAYPEYEVIVVDDGSYDGTSRVVRRYMEKNPRIAVYRHHVNRGYGAALRSGFAASQGELVFFMDADGQFDIRDLDRFFPLIDQYDGIIGYRLCRRDSWLRKVNALGWNLLCRLLLGLRVKDIDCAFKLYHRRVLDAISLESTGAMINTEMLAKIRARGFRLREVGVNHFPRISGIATGANPRVIARAFRELFSLYGRLRSPG